MSNRLRTVRTPKDLTGMRTRVLPSGVPDERREEQAAGDVTWEADLWEFERRVRAGESSLDNDWRIAEAIRSLLAQASAKSGP